MSETTELWCVTCDQGGGNLEVFDIEDLTGRNLEQLTSGGQLETRAIVGVFDGPQAAEQFIANLQRFLAGPEQIQGPELAADPLALAAGIYGDDNGQPAWPVDHQAIADDSQEGQVST